MNQFIKDLANLAAASQVIMSNMAQAIPTAATTVITPVTATDIEYALSGNNRMGVSNSVDVGSKSLPQLPVPQIQSNEANAIQVGLETGSQQRAPVTPISGQFNERLRALFTNKKMTPAAAKFVLDVITTAYKARNNPDNLVDVSKVISNQLKAYVDMLSDPTVSADATKKAVILSNIARLSQLQQRIYSRLLGAPLQGWGSGMALPTIPEQQQRGVSRKDIMSGMLMPPEGTPQGVPAVPFVPQTAALPTL